jgi:hypothetical protein
VNRSSINYGIVFKQGRLGDGPLSLCTNFVELEPVIMVASTGSKHFLGKGSLENTAKLVRIGTSLGALLFGPSGLSAMIKCSITNNGIWLRSNKVFGTNSSSMPKMRGTGFSSKLKSVTSWQRLCSAALTRLGVLGTSFVRDTIYIMSGIGRRLDKVAGHIPARVRMPPPRVGGT